MRFQQRLASGLYIRQDIANAIRLPLFGSDFPEFPLWTHGGSVVLLSYLGKVYALTCKHIVCGDSKLWSALMVPTSKHGGSAFLVSGCRTAHAAWGHAAETDILDLAVLRFTDDVDATAFGGGTYVLDPNTICRSRPGDELMVHATLKEKTEIGAGEIATTYCHLGFTDRGQRLNDHSLRTGHAVLENLVEIRTLNGISGGAVFNLSQRALCGIAVRAGLAGNNATLNYLDIHHAVRLVQAVHSGNISVRYAMNQEAFACSA